MNTIIGLVMLGIFAGFASGLIGIGGGLVLVPMLVGFFAFSQHIAQGTSLALFLFPVGLLGVMNYHKKGYVDWQTVGIIAVGFVLGSYLGSSLAVNMPQATLKRVFAIAIILIGLRMLWTTK